MPRKRKKTGTILFFALMFLMPCFLLWAGDAIEIDLSNESSTSKPTPTQVAVNKIPPNQTKTNLKNTESQLTAVSARNKTKSIINKVEIKAEGEQTTLLIKGEGLVNKPEVKIISKTKILVTFANAKLHLPKKITENKNRIKTIRSDAHGKSAWIVIDANGIKSATAEKSDDGFAVILNAGSNTEMDGKLLGKSGLNNESTPTAPSLEKRIFSRLTDFSIKPSDKGIKVVLTSDGPAKYNIRKIGQPERLVVWFHNTKLDVSAKEKIYKNDDLELKKGGLISIALRQIGKGFSPISDVTLMLIPGTVYKVDRDLNQVVISLTSPPPSEKSSETEKNAERKGNLNQLVSMDIESADLSTVLKNIAIESGFSNVDFVGGAIFGVVNEKFKDVPLKTALAILLTPGNYDYEVQGNTLRVGPIASLRATKSIMPHVTEILSPSGGMNLGQFDSLVKSILKPTNAIQTSPDSVRNVLVLNGTVSDIEEYKRAIKDLKLDENTSGDRITRVVKLNYADPTQMILILSAYLTPVGKVQQDPRTNDLVIWEVASNMGVLLELIKEIDVKSPQVLLETNMVEVQDEKDLNLGVDLALTRQVGDPQINANYVNPATNNPGFFGIQTLRSGINLSAQLSAAEARKKAKIISRPRVATANGVAAEIDTVENVVIENTTQTINQNVITYQTNFTQLPLPINLKVTPRITDDGRITTNMAVTVTSQTGPVVVAPQTGAQGPPPTSVQDTNTTITTKNGETIVIGGLVRYTVQDSMSGIPLLSSLPIIGTLFQNRTYTNQKVELVIFITPTLLED